MYCEALSHELSIYNRRLLLISLDYRLLLPNIYVDSRRHYRSVRALWSAGVALLLDAEAVQEEFSGD